MLRPEPHHAMCALCTTLIIDHMLMAVFYPQQRWMYWMVATSKLVIFMGIMSFIDAIHKFPQRARVCMIPCLMKLIYDWSSTLAFLAYINYIFVPSDTAPLERLQWLHWFFHYDPIREEELNKIPEYAMTRTGVTDASFWVITPSEVLRKKEEIALIPFQLFLSLKVIETISLGCWWIMYRRERNAEKRERKLAVTRAYNDGNAHQPYRVYFVANDDRLPRLHPEQMDYADPDHHVWNRPQMLPIALAHDNQRRFPPMPSQRMEGG